MKTVTKIGVLVALIARSSFAATDAGTTFYWTGGSGNWTDVSNWSLDAQGAQSASRYPGSDANVDNDVAQFTTTASGEIDVNSDISIFRLFVDSKAAGSADMTFKGGHLITATAINDSASKRSKLSAGRNVRFENVGFSGAYLDVNGHAIFDSGCKLTLSKALRQYNERGSVTFESGSRFEGAGCIEIRRNNVDTDDSGMIVINGGTFVGGGLKLMHTNAKLVYNGGDILMPLYCGDENGDNTTGTVVSVLSGKVLKIDDIWLRGAIIDNGLGGSIEVTNSLTIVGTPRIVPFKTSGEPRKVISLPQTKGGLVMGDFSFDFGCRKELRIVGGVQEIWCENLLFDNYDEKSGFVEQIEGGTSAGGQYVNPYDIPEAWSDRRVPHADTNYYCGTVGTMITTNATFAGRSMTLQGVLRMNGSNRRIDVPDLRGLSATKSTNKSTIMGGSETDRTQYIGGSVTVLSKKTDEAPFSFLGGKEGHRFAVEASLVGDELACLVAGRYSDGEYDISSTNTIDFLGDTTAYYGMVRVLKNTRLRLGASAFPGEIELAEGCHGLSMCNETAIRTEIGKLSSVGSSSVDIPAGYELAVTKGFAPAGDIAKYGLGTLALGGEAGVASGAPLKVCAGGLKALSGTAIGSLAVSFSAGSEIVVDWSPSDDSVANRGLDLSAASVTVEGSALRVRFDLNGETPSVGTYDKALLTVKKDIASSLNVQVAKPFKGVRADVEPVENGDETVTFFARIYSGGVILIVR